MFLELGAPMKTPEEAFKRGAAEGDALAARNYGEALLDWGRPDEAEVAFEVAIQSGGRRARGRAAERSAQPLARAPGEAHGTIGVGSRVAIEIEQERCLSLCERKAAEVKRRTGQPCAAAARRSARSGFTAKGCPTAWSSWMSDRESV